MTSRIVDYCYFRLDTSNVSLCIATYQQGTCRIFDVFKMGITNLEEQFTFYASYHHSTANKIIHILCVWPILWSAFVLAEYIPLEAPDRINSIVSIVHPFNVTLVTAVFYAAVYILMDKKAGSIGALLLLICVVTARKFYLEPSTTYGASPWQIAAIIHLACWVAQFVGHGVFEGRSPALFDNLMQALVMAPLFVLLEVIFPLGYRPELQKRVWKNVDKEIAKYKNGVNKVNAGEKKKIK